MVYEQEKILIDLIQHYHFLYDKSSRDYKDKNKKDNAWESIAVAMESSVEEMQRIWLRLRERYTKERRNIREQASGSAASESAWTLFGSMQFLEKYIQTRKRSTNVHRSGTSTPLCSPHGSTDSLWDTYGSIVGGNEEETLSQDESAIQNPTSGLQKDKVQEPQPGPSGQQQVKLCRPNILSDSEETSQEADIQPVHKRILPEAIFRTAETPKRKRKAEAPSSKLEDSLEFFKSYLKGKGDQKRDKNVAFADFVSLSLSEMGPEEQNYKPLKIMQVLNEDYPPHT